jgi:hypothetical protein
MSIIFCQILGATPMAYGILCMVTSKSARVGSFTVALKCLKVAWQKLALE